MIPVERRKHAWPVSWAMRAIMFGPVSVGSGGPSSLNFQLRLAGAGARRMIRDFLKVILAGMIAANFTFANSVRAGEPQSLNTVRVWEYNSPFVSDAKRFSEVQIPVRVRQPASGTTR
jgi:hypothetical protein